MDCPPATPATPTLGGQVIPTLLDSDPSKYPTPPHRGKSPLTYPFSVYRPWSLHPQQVRSEAGWIDLRTGPRTTKFVLDLFTPVYNSSYLSCHPL